MSHIALMVDAETLSLKPNALVLQLGFVKADLDTGEILMLPTTLFPDYDSQVQRGAHIDLHTVHWWMQQDRAVQASVFPGENARAVARLDAQGLYDRMAEFAEGVDSVWAWRTPADMPWIRNVCGGRSPWHFHKENDAPSLATALDPHGVLMPPKEAAAHNAAVDADWQMRYLIALWQFKNALLEK